MSESVKSLVANHRARKAREGFVRVEVSVQREDAGLVRQVAAVLSDPGRRATARAWLRNEFAERPKPGLKALLASAPLEGIDLSRDDDLGRQIDI